MLGLLWLLACGSAEKEVPQTCDAGALLSQFSVGELRGGTFCKACPSDVACQTHIAWLEDPTCAELKALEDAIPEEGMTKTAWNNVMALHSEGSARKRAQKELRDKGEAYDETCLVGE